MCGVRQPGPFRASVVSHVTPEVTSVAHASTGSFHPVPFQHDILIPMCSKGVSCWEGEEKRGEASTWALFLGLRQDGPPVDTRNNQSTAL